MWSARAATARALAAIAALAALAGCSAAGVTTGAGGGSVTLQSVYFNYPDANAFYHGQLQVSSSRPGTIVVPAVNDYVASCVTSYATTVDVYDGPERAPVAPELASIPVTLTVSC